MRFAFMLYPEADLDSAVAQWKRWGFESLWQPDEETVILGSPKRGRAEVMLEDNPAEHRIGIGPVFIVDEVDAFKANHPELDWLLEPCDVPAGRYAAYGGPNQSPVRILDLTSDPSELGALFVGSGGEAAEVP